jgi:site-specific DNA-methyltransferase (adenine-specific)
MVKPYYQDSAVTIYHGDCREIVPQLGMVDMVITDPPYGMNFVSNQRTTPALCNADYTMELEL